MTGASASKSFAEQGRRSRRAAAPCLPRGDAATQRRGYSAVTWLNLVCLDAPLVAIGWQWLFAWSFDLSVPKGGTAALFLTAWLIYVADRLGDSLSIDLGRATSLRQRFCYGHR